MVINWLAHMNMECWMCKFTMALIRMQSRFDMMNDKHMLQANTQGYQGGGGGGIHRMTEQMCQARPMEIFNLEDRVKYKLQIKPIENNIVGA